MIWPQVMHTSKVVGLEHLPCAVQPGEGMIQEDLKADCQYYRGHLEGLFIAVHSGKMRENGHRWKQERVRLGFPMRSAKHCHSQAVQQGGCEVSIFQNLTRQVHEQPARAGPALSIAWDQRPPEVSASPH